MAVPREDVVNSFMEILRSMGDEWEDASAFTEESSILGDLNWRSIELLYLAKATQRKYNQTFPFEDFLKAVERRESKDMKIREWVDFIYSHLNANSYDGCPEP